MQVGVDDINRRGSQAGCSTHPLGQRVAHGALWTIGVSVAGKLVSLASQIALAWFLLPSDMGLVAMAMSVAGMVSVLAGTNLTSLLIQRQKQFTETAGQVFWLSLAMNCIGSLVLIGVAPFTHTLFGEARVAPLVFLIALACPFMALPTIYSAALSHDLRFGTISRIQFALGLIQNGTAVALAAAGLGAYALVLPLFLIALSGAIMNRAAAGAIPLPRPDLSQWTPLLAASVWLMLTSLFSALRNYGTSFAIGAIIKDSTVTGLYYWGYTIAFQAIFLVATNLQGVLFPALSKLNEAPERQFAAFRKILSVLGPIAVVVCLLQVLLARPVVSLVFHERWLRAVPVVQWLSVGAITQPLSIAAFSLLSARGRFGLVALLSAVNGALITGASAIGACLGHEIQIAQWTGLCILATNVLPAWAVYRMFDRSCARLLLDSAHMLTIGIPVLLCSWAAARISSGWGSLAEAVAVCAVAGCASILLARAIMPGITADVWAHLKGLRQSGKVLGGGAGESA